MANLQSADEEEKKEEEEKEEEDEEPEEDEYDEEEEEEKVWNVNNEYFVGSQLKFLSYRTHLASY